MEGPQGPSDGPWGGRQTPPTPRIRAQEGVSGATPTTHPLGRYEQAGRWVERNDTALSADECMVVAELPRRERQGQRRHAITVRVAMRYVATWGSLHGHRHRVVRSASRAHACNASHRIASLLRIASHRDDITTKSSPCSALAPYPAGGHDRHRMAYAVAIHETPEGGPAWPRGGHQRVLPRGPKTDPRKGAKIGRFWGSPRPPKNGHFGPPRGGPPGPPARARAGARAGRGEIPGKFPPRGGGNRSDFGPVLGPILDQFWARFGPISQLIVLSLAPRGGA